ncbi:uncharacterized protein LAJ45_02380 [Morchella importuna]|uniref:tRNA wybutosine-synthesizing protein 3 n=1 Tax=Morchella conica CCBAS932 TaxID=1392247 RepID=A0A3N4KZM3_9PEZI|nr:uncharacterized protein LAJ45_02380 [Morchella importuna]KAH8153567.1 hypothetical protein LAJ45_02380 [Morchella importuna]RPB14722.1 hypothetical protein P167DRAFT_563455 [Morchella conica CCBAS932]
MSSPEARFAINKSRILAEIASTAPDASPKGSIDVQILPLINQLNQHDRLFTTSSCSGRISVFFEGVKKSIEPIGSEELQGDDRGNRASQAGIGGKGEGGKWLFVSHDPVSDVEKKSNREIAEILFRGEKDKAVTDIASNKGGLCEPVELEMGDVVDFDISSTTRFVHLKFEPMILHIQTADLKTANEILTVALSVGFRESGIMNPGLKASSFPMVAIRCNGLIMDSIIGIIEHPNGQIRKLVDDIYLKTLLKVCNLRFKENQRRIDAFTTKIGETLFSSGTRKSEGYEDKEIRKARKREEGLRKQRELRSREQD